MRTGKDDLPDLLVWEILPTLALSPLPPSHLKSLSLRRSGGKVVAEVGTAREHRCKIGEGVACWIDLALALRGRLAVSAEGSLRAPSASVPALSLTDLVGDLLPLC